VRRTATRPYHENVVNPNGPFSRVTSDMGILRQLKQTVPDRRRESSFSETRNTCASIR